MRRAQDHKEKGGRMAVKGRMGSEGIRWLRFLRPSHWNGESTRPQ